MRRSRVGRLVAALCGWLLLAAQVAGCEDPGRERRWVVASPDGRLEVTVALGSRAAFADEEGGRLEGALSYEARRDGAVVLEPSPLGIETDRGTFLEGIRVDSVEEREVDESYRTTVGKRRDREVRGNELVLGLRDGGGDAVELVFRVHDDGLAYRYRLLGEGEVVVRGEASGFAVPSGGTGFMAPYDLGGLYFFGTYEQVFEVVPVGEPTSATGWAYPALFEVPGDEGAASWLLVTEADLRGSYCGTRLHEEPAGGLYRVRLPYYWEGAGVGEVEPRSDLPLLTPWRVVVVGDLATVVESTLVDDLSAPSVVEDVSWIRPGRSAWSWLTQGTGDPELQRRYVAFAEEMGWEHVLVDEGWDRWPEVDAAVPALVEDAAAAGVGVLLWYNSGGDHTPIDGSPRDRMVDPDVRRAEMDRLESWGVAGIKVDFFESDKQDRIQQYLAILEDAAARHLLVNFHGATVPRGWQRTYPHLMSHEAVRGAEYFRVSPASVPRPGADEHVIYAFTRNAVGSMDYTPVVFADALSEAGLPYVHSLAEAVLFESGLQHFADRADGEADQGYGAVFAAYPFVRDVLAEVPVVWDETRLLDGDPRSHVVLARRSGGRWYVAGIAGEDDEVALALSLDFLGEGDHLLRLVISGDDPAAMAEERRTVDASSTLEVELAPRDGFVAIFERAD